MSALSFDEHGDLPLPVPLPVARVLVRFNMLLRMVGAAVALAMLPMGLVGPLEVSLFLAFYVITMLGVTVGFHRLFAHRAFEAKPGLRWALGIAGTMAGQGPATFWVGTHRRHHQRTEQAGDPHSPHPLGEAEGWGQRLKAFWQGHMGWIWQLKIQGWGPYVPDLLAEPMMLQLHRHADAITWAGLLLPGAIAGAVHQSWTGAFVGFLWGGCLRLVAVEQVVYLVNSWGHHGRRRPFLTHDRSANVPLLGLLALGDGWHNNHHAFPSAARAGLLPGQVDLGHLAIRAWVALGWASKAVEVSEAQLKAKLAAP